MFECCLCMGEGSTACSSKKYTFCSRCVERSFTTDSFSRFDNKFGGGGVNTKGAWCSNCVEDCDEKEDVGWFCLRYVFCLVFNFALLHIRSMVAGNEVVVTPWRMLLQMAERRRDEQQKALAAQQLQQQPAWMAFVANAEVTLCMRCPSCLTALQFDEDDCVALKCLLDHPGQCHFCSYCDMVRPPLNVFFQFRIFAAHSKMQVLVDSPDCHRHAAVCPRRPPGANGLFPGNAAWVRAVRAMMGLHKLHLDFWKIIPEENFQSAYTALIPVLVQFRRIDLSSARHAHDEQIPLPAARFVPMPNLAVAASACTVYDAAACNQLAPLHVSSALVALSPPHAPNPCFQPPSTFSASVAAPASCRCSPLPDLLLPFTTASPPAALQPSVTRPAPAAGRALNRPNRVSSCARATAAQPCENARRWSFAPPALPSASYAVLGDAAAAHVLKKGELEGSGAVCADDPPPPQL